MTRFENGINQDQAFTHHRRHHRHFGFARRAQPLGKLAPVWIVGFGAQGGKIQRFADEGAALLRQIAIDRLLTQLLLTRAQPRLGDQLIRRLFNHTSGLTIF
jgi:hypothetical protein